jgi:hypothetical protein
VATADSRGVRTDGDQHEEAVMQQARVEQRQHRLERLRSTCGDNEKLCGGGSLGPPKTPSRQRSVDRVGVHGRQTLGQASTMPCDDDGLA